MNADGSLLLLGTHSSHMMRTLEMHGQASEAVAGALTHANSGEPSRKMVAAMNKMPSFIHAAPASLF